MLREILHKVLDTNTEEEFFDKMFKGFSVTLDHQTGELVYLDVSNLDWKEIREDALP